MADRSSRTTLTLGAVSAPIALWKTTTDKRSETSFDTAGPNGGKLRARAGVVTEPEKPVDAPQDPLADEAADPIIESVPARYGRLLVEEGTGEAVGPGEVRKGIRTATGEFIDLTEHLQAVEQMTKLEEMRIEGFVSVGAIERTLHRIHAAYWVGPADGSAYTLALIRSAMLRELAVGVVRWTKRTRQSLGLLVVDEQGLLLLDVAFADMTRDPKRDVHLAASLEVRDEHLAMARELVAEMTYPEGLVDQIEDDAVEMKAALAEIAREGEVPEVPSVVPVETDLSEALQRSLVA
jgi:non-homologous end joining protein Ku